MRLLYQSGIKRVIIREKYRDFEDLKKMMDIEILEQITEEGFIELNYQPKRAVILVIGSNPASKSPDNSAFHIATASGRKVRSWLDDLHIDAHYINVSDKKTLANRSLTKKEIKNEISRLKVEIHLLKPDAIISVGKTAKYACDLLDVDSFYMPHPSGLSRFWNSEDESTEAVETLRRFIQGV
jgi:uracil-DNA glycosylase